MDAKGHFRRRAVFLKTGCAKRLPFKKSELPLVGPAAALVFSRLFGLNLVLPNFHGHFESDFVAVTILIGLAVGPPTPNPVPPPC